MSYALEADILAFYGEDMLVLAADADDITSIDHEKVQRGLDDATSMINGYIGRAVTLPLSQTPPLLRQLCIDIAVYRMCPDAPRRTEEMRKRYEDAISMLRDIAKGLITLAEDETAEDAVITRGWIGSTERI